VVNISAAGAAKSATANPSALASLSLGRGGTGTVTVDGAGSQLLLTGAMYAGIAGNGIITLTENATSTESAVGTGFASAVGNVNGKFARVALLAAGVPTVNLMGNHEHMIQRQDNRCLRCSRKQMVLDTAYPSMEMTVGMSRLK